MTITVLYPNDKSMYLSSQASDQSSVSRWMRRSQSIDRTSVTRRTRFRIELRTDLRSHESKRSQRVVYSKVRWRKLFEDIKLYTTDYNPSVSFFHLPVPSTEFPQVVLKPRGKRARVWWLRDHVVSKPSRPNNFWNKQLNDSAISLGLNRI